MAKKQDQGPPPHAPTQRDLPNLPSDVDSEKLILGSILLDDGHYDKVAEKLSAADFILEKHKRIFSAMEGVRKAELKIDRITIVKELQKRNHLESCDGMTYIVSLDEGLPQIPHLDSYVKMVRDRGIQRRIIFASAKYAKQVMAGTGDTKQILAAASAAFFDLQQQADSESKTVFSGEEIVQSEGLEAVLRPWDHSPGLPTEFEKLDDKIYGLQPGNVIGIAAATSAGKTALAGNIVMNLLRRGDGVLYFGSEMSNLSMLHRMASARCGISYARFRRGWLKPEELREFHDAISKVVDMPLFCDETSPLTIHDFESRTARMVQAGKVKLAVLDYIQLMDLRNSGNGDTFFDERAALTAISGRLVKLAKTLRIPLIYLSQFSRASRGRDKSDRRPKLSDLFGSSSLEHNSHIVLALYREEFDKPGSVELKNTAELLILKNRNGERGTVHLLFNGGSMTFTECEPPEPPPEPEKPVKKKGKSKEVPAEHQDSLLAPPPADTNT